MLETEGLHAWEKVKQTIVNRIDVVWVCIIYFVILKINF